MRRVCSFSKMSGMEAVIQLRMYIVPQVKYPSLLADRKGNVCRTLKESGRHGVSGNSLERRDTAERVH